MKRLSVLLIELTALAFVFAQMASAATYYVATNGAGGDFLSWGTAATNIQDAISKATTANDIVLVSNGVYKTGGVTNCPIGSSLTNRVAITNAITVMSANTNPANTIIKGRFDTGEPGESGTVTNGPAAVRCVYMVASSKLIGFTLTNGATFTTGDPNDAGGGVYCYSRFLIISNCIIAGNSANYGGGVYNGPLYNCTLIGNSAMHGGGTYPYNASLYTCTLISNSASKNGGGANLNNGILYNCTLIGNSASNGGGVYTSGAVSNCTLIGNSADQAGGGAFGGATVANLYNCTLIGNSASNGGGTAYANLYNCTIVSNFANYGGGVWLVVAYNCIVYFNRAGNSGSNWYDSTQCSFTNSCTAPTTTVWAAGNITADPIFVDKDAGNWRLQANSPCINAGTNQSWMTNSYDLDWRTRIRYGTVDMGAYENIYNGTIYQLW